MNKIKELVLSFFLAPVTAFFLPKVYRDAVKASWLKGVLYILYGALIMVALVMAIFLERASTSDKFIHWVKENTPVVIWTPKGLSLENGQKTATLVHPVYGPIAAFDMDRETVSEEDMGKRFLFVTSKRIVFRKMMGELEDRDVTKPILRAQQSLPASIRITGELIRNFYWTGKLIVLSTTPFVVFAIAFLVLGVMNGLYAFVGLLLNEIRGQKLNFGEIFNLACFSTGTTLAFTIAIMVGLFFSVSLPLLLMPTGLLVSLLYMIAAVIFVEKPNSPHS